MVNIKYSILLLSFFVLSSYIPIHAQEIIPTVSEVTEVELIKEEYQMLKEQNLELVQSAKEEREKHYQFVNDIYTHTRNFLIFVIAVIGFLGWKTLKDIKKDAKKLAQESYKKTIDDNSSNLRDNIRSINEIVDRETIFKSKRIGFIYHHKDSIDLENITRILKQRGFVNTTELQIDRNTDTNTLNINTFNVVIYILKEFKTEKQLLKDKVIINLLKGTEIPLILYTNLDNTIKIKDMDELIKEHKWIIPANNRISLLNNIFNVADLFS